VRFGIWLAGFLCVTHVFAAQQNDNVATDSAPLVTIIIDDMGNLLHSGRRAVALPGAVTINILPFTPYATYFAQQAERSGKEVMLHIPMEAINGRKLGSGGLYADMNHAQFDAVLSASLKSIPNIRGISNHMGSRLTQNGRMMEWLMSGLVHHGRLYFVDSRTTVNSLALEYARKNQLPHAKRDVFLDHEQTSEHILKQWHHLIQLARREGSAVAVAHPYPVTLDFLEQRLPDIEAEGIRLVSVSELLDWRNLRRKYAWQTSSSPSPRAVKN